VTRPAERAVSFRPSYAGPAAASDHPLRPTALEIAAGRMFGEDGAAAGIAHVEDRGQTPLAALDEALLPALQQDPCLVSFSGGRDSSGVLAAATLAARREGLPPPVPVTLRVGNAPMAEESAWQERVVRHLGLRDWELLHVGEEMDRLGPFSVAVLRRHGVLYPPNTFLQIPLLEAARGGCLLSGLGGDELFASWRWRNHADALARRRYPTPRDVLRLGYAASPAALRGWREGRRQRLPELVWLRSEAARSAARLHAAARAEQPRSWSRWVDWFARRRSVSAPRWSLSLLAADADTVLVHPLLDPRFLAAIARTGRHVGFGDRTAAMRAVFGEALPDAVLSRPTKARFGEVFWGRGTRDFAARWSGVGVYPELVDPVALKNEWLKPGPHEDSAMLLHAAWLMEQT
jgi:asparagine synthetase B (glutamine-hydrolysing)